MLCWWNFGNAWRLKCHSQITLFFFFFENVVLKNTPLQICIQCNLMPTSILGLIQGSWFLLTTPKQFWKYYILFSAKKYLWDQHEFFRPHHHFFPEKKCMSGNHIVLLHAFVTKKLTRFLLRRWQIQKLKFYLYFKTLIFWKGPKPDSLIIRTHCNLFLLEFTASKLPLLQEFSTRLQQKRELLYLLSVAVKKVMRLEASIRRRHPMHGNQEGGLQGCARMWSHCSSSRRNFAQ